MDEQDDYFSVVLPSNSNMNTQPGNQPSDYTVQLRKPLELSRGDWQVAIMNMQYPYNWYNFRDDVTVLVVEVSDDGLDENSLNQLDENSCCVDEHHAHGQG